MSMTGMTHDESSAASGTGGSAINVASASYADRVHWGPIIIVSFICLLNVVVNNVVPHAWSTLIPTSALLIC